MITEAQMMAPPSLPVCEILGVVSIILLRINFFGRVSIVVAHFCCQQTIEEMSVEMTI